MIELKNISKSYNGIPVLQDISMTFRDNGCYCLMSPSGSGKTTLMRILMGLEQPDTGTVRIYGQDGEVGDCRVAGDCRAVRDHRETGDFRTVRDCRAARGHREAGDFRAARIGRTSLAISAVFQEDRLCESFSPLENVMMCAGRSIKASLVRQEMEKLLPAKCLDRPVSTLSGGMKRRVAVYRALLTPSDVLVMDEPFTGMDEELKHSVIAYIREKQAGRILILSTHQEEDVKLIGGELVRITSMNIRHL
ncbi:ABC transporter ATP-binding protein [Enterocloster aldenensis]|jgi:NitT/TauT family transport system ATP-binding protein|uniref:ATP-binding cassette domain-containing protein n=1 Tax=Enterocloster aldenensis TaxID=358742 RepID=UPI000E48B60F|nr:ABC transporter ATP-binding protein [Enterocloster aldenensis]